MDGEDGFGVCWLPGNLLFLAHRRHTNPHAASRGKKGINTTRIHKKLLDDNDRGNQLVVRVASSLSCWQAQQGDPPEAMPQAGFRLGSDGAMLPGGSGGGGNHGQLLDDWLLAARTSITPAPRCPLHLEEVDPCSGLPHGTCLRWTMQGHNYLSPP